MANNVPMKDAADDTRVFGTVEIDGVHYPAHVAVNSGAFDTFAAATLLTTGSSANVAVGMADDDDLRPGTYQLSVWGTAGTSTLKLQYSPNDGTTWIDTDITEIAENVTAGVRLAAGLYRLTVVDPGGGSSWNADLRGV